MLSQRFTHSWAANSGTLQRNAPQKLGETVIKAKQKETPGMYVVDTKKEGLTFWIITDESFNLKLIKCPPAASHPPPTGLLGRQASQGAACGVPQGPVRGSAAAVLKF